MHLTAEQALAAADEVKPGDPRPFAGVPIAIKDLVALTARRPHALRHARARRLRARRATRTRTAACATPGAIMVGKTSTPEFGILPVTEPERVRPDAQPVGHEPHARRVVGRQRRGGRRPA